MSQELTEAELDELMYAEIGKLAPTPSASLPVYDAPVSIQSEVRGGSSDCAANSCSSTQEEIQEEITAKSQFSVPFEFESAVELLSFFDEAVREGKKTLYSWQVKAHDDLVAARPTTLNPFYFTLCAANGSGKDAYVVAPFAVWFIFCKIRSRCIITSSSGVQLTSQTENYIRSLCQRINKYFVDVLAQPEVFKINQRYIYCVATGSEIRLFATDEAGKAEGYHPFPDAVNGELALIINEAKSVEEEIFKALTRCTFNYWLEVSTPGEPHGHFHDSFNANRPNSVAIRVTAFDCPAHIGLAKIEETKRKWGERSATYRSQVLALFTSLGGQVVITQESIDYLILHPPIRRFQDWPKRVGIDIAAGGDETVIHIWRGNVCLLSEAWHEADTTVTVDRIDMILRREGISQQHEHIYLDDGGIGHAVADQLSRKKWNINRIWNQSPAIDKSEFGNRGAEMWTVMSRIIGECQIILPADQLLHKQLANRFYKEQPAHGKITLESKKEAKSKGHPSPDRADAMILAFTGLTLEDFLGAPPKQDDEQPHGIKLGSTWEEIKTNYEQQVTFGQCNNINPHKMSKLNGSLNVLLHNNN